MRKTVTDVFNDFQSFADQNLMINSLKTTPLNIERLFDEDYPLLYVEIRNLNFADGLANLSLKVDALSRLFSDGSNIVDVASDTSKIMTDFNSYFNDKLEELGYTLDNSISSEFIFYGKQGDKSNEDVLAGFSADVIVQIPNDCDEDEIPLSE